MSLEVFRPIKRQTHEHVMIYSRPGFGKTRLATSLTSRWGEVLYYAADMGAAEVGSVLRKHMGNIHVVNPTSGKIDPKTKKKEASNPVHDFTEFCMMDWNGFVDPTTGEMPYKNVKTLVVDTYTTIANKCLQWSADHSSVTAEQHFRIGDPEHGGRVVPNRGDYLGLYSITRGFMDLLDQHQSHMNIIFNMHEELNSPEGAAALGGPSHPGQQMLEELPGMFDTVIRITRKPVPAKDGKPATFDLYANTAPTGVYLGKVRENGEGGNPIPSTKLNIDPINFWEIYDSEIAHIETPVEQETI